MAIPNGAVLAAVLPELPEPEPLCEPLPEPPVPLVSPAGGSTNHPARMALRSTTRLIFSSESWFRRLSKLTFDFFILIQIKNSAYSLIRVFGISLSSDVLHQRMNCATIVNYSFISSIVNIR